MKAGAVALLFAIIIGCAARSDAKEKMLGQEFNLKIGQKARIKGEDLTINFSSVAEDSRCPEGVDCIWAGNAKIVLKLSKSNGASTSIELNTNTEPREKSFERYEIVLKKLSPYPKKDSSIKKKDYVATLVVKKIPN